MKKLVWAATAAMLGAVVATPAWAQFQRTDDAIKYRQGAMTLIGTHFSRVAAMASGRAPFDAKAAADNADLVATLSKLPFTAFVEGSDKGLPTRAKPEIWKEPAKFKEAADKFQAEAAKLDAAAKAGNLDQIKAAVGAVGQSCKACHDNYRAER